jgi:archaellum biogenesis ATPase FlaH
LRVNFDADDSPKEFVAVASRWLEELGENLSIEDKQPITILKRLVNRLREEQILILIDSLESLLTKSEDGWAILKMNGGQSFFRTF